MDPKVSFLIPVQNEGEHLRESLDSISALDYPMGQIEILIADAHSTDETGEVVQRFREEHPQLCVRRSDNPTGNTAIGRNLCLECATGNLVMNYSGHAVARPDLLRVLVDKFSEQTDEVAGVGCATLSAKSGSFFGKLIAAVLGSAMGGKGAVDSSYQAPGDRMARSIAFTLYRKQVLDELGGFDEIFWCGQDAELNLRLAGAGYKLLYTSDTGVHHHKRSTLGGFVSQMYRYGIARAMLARKHPSSLRLVFLLPSLFVLIAVAVLVSCFFSTTVAWGTLVAAGVFVIVSLASTVATGAGIVAALGSPLLYLVMYFGYGLGFLRGLLPFRWLSLES